MKAILLVLVLAASALAANKGCPSGTFTTQTGTGGNADSVAATTSSLAVQAITTAGTATVILEISCNAGTSWAAVTGASMTLATGVAQAVSVLGATCRYRTNVTACASCNVQTWYACGR